MQPSIIETIDCVLHNLEELVFPGLTEEHAQSVARCTSILLRVVMLRLEHEPAMLAADSAEKRVLFEALGHALPERSTVVEGPEDLARENDALKAELERFIRTLHADRTILGEERFATAQQAVRIQLRAQIDREHELVAGPFGGPGFPY